MNDDLRDARLQRALEHAPDAHMRPDAAVRQAIFRAAHEAARGAAAPSAANAAKPGQPGQPAASWWSRWRGAGGGHMPWNAAFATVLIAGFVTMLWQGQEVPDARLDTAAPGVAKPAPAPAAAPAPAPAVAPEKPKAPLAERNRQNERERERREDRKERKATTKEERLNEASPAVAQEPAAAVQAAPAAKVAQVAPVAPAAMADAAPRPAPAMAAAPPPMAELRARAAAPAAASPAASLPAPTALPYWTALRVEGARVSTTARGDAGVLPSLLQALSSSVARSGAPSAGAASGSVAFASGNPLRLELMQGSDVLGVLEITGTQWRFAPAGGSPVQAGRADAQTVLALRAEIQRLGLVP